jgi:hypothetical protein
VIGIAFRAWGGLLVVAHGLSDRAGLLGEQQ